MLYNGLLQLVEFIWRHEVVIFASPRVRCCHGSIVDSLRDSLLLKGVLKSIALGLVVVFYFVLSPYASAM